MNLRRRSIQILWMLPWALLQLGQDVNCFSTIHRPPAFRASHHYQSTIRVNQLSSSFSLSTTTRKALQSTCTQRTLSTSSTSTSKSPSTTRLSMASTTPPPPYPVRIAVMGGGNFGLALATVCARQGIPTTLLVRKETIAQSINTNHTHPAKMKEFVFPHTLRATTNPEECLPDATYIIHAVPVQYSRQFLETVKDYIPPTTPVLSGSKGIETSSLGFMYDILKESLGNERPYAFLSGPSFAQEICNGVATAVVIASEDLLLARDLASLLSDDSFRCFTTKDVMGVEIGGAVKNVIALAAGMCEGLGLGTNAMSGLVTRGCGEMRRLGLTLGARPSTIAGLSGTCFVWYIHGAPHCGAYARSEVSRFRVVFSWCCCRLCFAFRRRRYFRNMLWSIVAQPKIWVPIGTR